MRITAKENSIRLFFIFYNIYFLDFLGMSQIFILFYNYWIIGTFHEFILKVYIIESDKDIRRVRLTSFYCIISIMR